MNDEMNKDALDLLGKAVHDIATEFAGIVTAVCIYQQASARLRVETLLRGKIHEEWLAFDRCTAIVPEASED